MGSGRADVVSDPFGVAAEEDVLVFVAVAVSVGEVPVCAPFDFAALIAALAVPLEDPYAVAPGFRP